MSKDQRSLNFCYTLNNWTVEEAAQLQAVPCRYHQYGEEVGASGTPHLQGFICFNNARYFAAVKKLLPERCHIEVMKGRIEHNEAYVSKENLAFTKGEPPLTQAQKGQMEKDRYAAAIELAKEGKIDQIDADLQVRHYNTWKQIYKDNPPKLDCNDKLENFWYFGPSGCGKSSSARRNYPNAYYKLPNKWWDGYKGESEVIIEDLDPSHADHMRYHLKLWCDHGPFRAETKGGSIMARPRTIIVTSQYSLEQIFSDAESLAALARRFTLVPYPPASNLELASSAESEGSVVNRPMGSQIAKRPAFVHWANLNKSIIS